MARLDQPESSTIAKIFVWSSTATRFKIFNFDLKFVKVFKVLSRYNKNILPS
jgi:hypothetical protein